MNHQSVIRLNRMVGSGFQVSSFICAQAGCEATVVSSLDCCCNVQPSPNKEAQTLPSSSLAGRPAHSVAASLLSTKARSGEPLATPESPLAAALGEAALQLSLGPWSAQPQPRWPSAQTPAALRVCIAAWQQLMSKRQDPPHKHRDFHAQCTQCLQLQ